MSRRVPQFVDERFLQGGHKWPITVWRRRYSGVYEGAQWVAFALEAKDLPEQIEKDNVAAMWFWCDERLVESKRTRWVGRGATPDAAVLDLKRRVGER